jgi:cell wall-associated NlpC family hydrolase
VYQVYRNSRAAYGSYLTVAMIKQSPYFAEVTYPSPGDLILFRKKIGGYEHVGIYLWHGYFIHASYGAGKVVIDHIDNSPYYGQGFWRQYQPYFVRWMLGIA